MTWAISEGVEINGVAPAGFIETRCPDSSMFTVNRIPPSFANKSTDGILIYGLIAAFLRTVESVQLRVEVIIAGRIGSRMHGRTSWLSSWWEVYFFYWLIVDTKRGLYLEPLEDRSDVIDQISPVDDTFNSTGNDKSSEQPSVMVLWSRFPGAVLPEARSSSVYKRCRFYRARRRDMHHLSEYARM
ncbi:hypothetical protein V8E54_012058 [Elaphomyces granulatus]